MAKRRKYTAYFGRVATLLLMMGGRKFDIESATDRLDLAFMVDEIKWQHGELKPHIANLKQILDAMRNWEKGYAIEMDAWHILAVPVRFKFSKDFL